MAQHNTERNWYCATWVTKFGSYFVQVDILASNGPCTWSCSISTKCWSSKFILGVSVHSPITDMMAKMMDGTDAWNRVGMDINHYNGKYYLALLNCGTTQVPIWWHIQPVWLTIWKPYSLNTSNLTLILLCICPLGQRHSGTIPLKHQKNCHQKAVIINGGSILA